MLMADVEKKLYKFLDKLIKEIGKIECVVVSK